MSSSGCDTESGGAVVVDASVNDGIVVVVAVVVVIVFNANGGIVADRVIVSSNAAVSSGDVIVEVIFLFARRNSRLLVVLHRFEQVVTSFQHLSHFFLHVMTLPQVIQSLASTCLPRSNIILVGSGSGSVEIDAFILEVALVV